MKSEAEGVPDERTAAERGHPFCQQCAHVDSLHDERGCRVVLVRGPRAREFQNPEVAYVLCSCTRAVVR